MSDADHQPSRTRVPMPVAALSDPHMGDAAKNPERTEQIIAIILVFAIIFFGVGDHPAIFLVFLASFFPIVVACISGVYSVPPNLRSAGSGSMVAKLTFGKNLL